MRKKKKLKWVFFWFFSLGQSVVWLPHSRPLFVFFIMECYSTWWLDSLSRRSCIGGLTLSNVFKELFPYFWVCRGVFLLLCKCTFKSLDSVMWSLYWCYLDWGLRALFLETFGVRLACYSSFHSIAEEMLFHPLLRGKREALWITTFYFV